MDALNMIKSMLVFANLAIGAVAILVGALTLFPNLFGEHQTGEVRNSAIIQMVGGAVVLAIAYLMVEFIREPDFRSTDAMVVVTEVLRWLVHTIGTIGGGKADYGNESCAINLRAVFHHNVV